MGSPIQKSEEAYSVAITVVKTVKSYKEDSYDKSISNVFTEEVPVASVDITGTDMEELRKKLHAHIDLI